jgi:hypothetical protein
MSQPEPELDPVVEFDRQPAVAFVETDRYCEGCGYNLRTQPVRRDARIRVLLCRCPECGGFQPVREGVTAGQVWLQRLGTLGLLAWIVTLLGVGFGLGAAQVGLTMIPLEELTRYRQVVIPVTPAKSQPAGGGTTMTMISGQRITVTQSGTTTTTRYRREVREHYPYYRAFMALMHASSFALGFLLTLMAVVVFHHWRRWGYLVPAVFVSIVTGMLTWYIWLIHCPHLLDWAEPIITGQSAAHLAGALTGILLGRPFARLLVTLMLPQKLRQVLAFLWLADGKQPPVARAG